MRNPKDLYMNKLRFPIELYIDFASDLATLSGGIDIYMRQADYGRRVAVAACLPFIDDVIIRTDAKDDFLTKKTIDLYEQLKLHIMTSEIYWELTCNDEGKSLYDYVLGMRDWNEYLELLNGDLPITKVRIDPKTHLLDIDYKEEVIDWLIDWIDKANLILDSKHAIPDSLSTLMAKKGIEIPKQDLERFFNEEE